MRKFAGAPKCTMRVILLFVDANVDRRRPNQRIVDGAALDPAIDQRLRLGAVRAGEGKMDTHGLDVGADRAIFETLGVEVGFHCRAGSSQRNAFGVLSDG